MKTIFELTELLAVVRNYYKQEVDKAKKEFEETRVNIPKEYIGRRAVEEREKAEAKLKSTMEKLREGCREMYEPLFLQMRMEAEAKASVMDSKLFETVRAFLDISLTEKEFNAISCAYGNRNYYTDRLLEEIAIKNGITVTSEEAKLPPRLDIKLSILNDLENQVEHILQVYGTVDEDAEARTAYLYPAILTRAEKMYTNGLEDDEKTCEQITSRLIDELSFNLWSGKKAFRNAYYNASAKTKFALLDAVSQSEKARNATQNINDIKDELFYFENGGKNEFEIALNEAERIVISKDDADLCRNIVQSNKGNRYFEEMLRTDSELKSIVGSAE